MVILLTLYCLGHGIQTVFTHIYYVPIILATYWFRRMGVLYAGVMGIIYLGCVAFYSGSNPQILLAAVARVLVFLVIAAVVMILAERIAIQQDEIVQSEKKFRSIWEHILAGIIIVDADTHEIIAVNPEGERLTGYSEKEMVGQTCHKFICPAEKGNCPISDLHLTLDRSERVLLNRHGESIPVLKTVTETTIGGRRMLIENYVPLPEKQNSP
jgi:PAS domain S-box-containing protein